MYLGRYMSVPLPGEEMRLCEWLALDDEVSVYPWICRPHPGLTSLVRPRMCIAQELQLKCSDKTRQIRRGSPLRRCNSENNTMPVKRPRRVSHWYARASLCRCMRHCKALQLGLGSASPMCKLEASESKGRSTRGGTTGFFREIPWVRNTLL